MGRETETRGQSLQQGEEHGGFEHVVRLCVCVCVREREKERESVYKYE